MATIYHQVAINVPVAKVYEAISTAEGIGTWWDEQTPVQTEHGLVLEHNPGPAHGVVKLRVVELTPDKRVEWECISNHPESSPASAWTGTHFIFEIAERQSAAASAECGFADLSCQPGSGHITTLDFRQTGYDEESEFYGFNNFAWAQVLSNLKRVCESLQSS